MHIFVLENLPFWHIYQISIMWLKQYRYTCKYVMSHSIQGVWMILI